MSIGGVRNIGAGSNLPQNSGSSANSSNSGQEFSLEKQEAGSTGALVQSNAAKIRNSKVIRIADGKKRNRKGAPRTLLVDGEIYEVYLLAIA
jgi:hypothetical protein